jgi:peptidyl-dipeptidase Dcp
MNPLLNEFQTPYQVPPFDKIQFEHFKPAFEAGLLAQEREFQAIENETADPTFKNTIEALERSGQMLTSVSLIFFNLMGTDSTPEMNELAKEISPLLAAQKDRLYMSKAIFDRVDLLKQNPSVHWSTEQRRLIDEHHKSFIRSGIQLAKEEQSRVESINKSLAELSIQYQQNLLAENNSSTMLLTKEDDLAGLPEKFISEASTLAKEEGHTDAWLFKATQTTLYPFLTFSQNRTARKTLYKAYTNRGGRENDKNNQNIVKQMATLRQEKSNILGYKNHAEYVLSNTMAKTPQQVLKFLDSIWEPALNSAKKESSEIQNKIRELGKDHKLEPWDWWYYSELIREDQYDFRDEDIKPYFSVESVLQGAISVSESLFNIRFQERVDLPKHHPQVRSFEVLKGNENDGSFTVFGILYIDYFTRPSKRSGAWMSIFRGQSNIDSPVLPVVINVCNFPPPSEDSPSLLSSGQVKTLFHEFGHALHGLLSEAKYPSLSGTKVVRDYVEFPSQLMENWGHSPEVIKTYAFHYKSGEIIPDSLLSKMTKANKFNQGFSTTEYLAASYLDLFWHLQGDESESVNDFEAKVIKRIGLIPEIGFRYRSTYFSHIFAGGYSASYYCYIWAAILETDAFALFEEKGLYDQESAQKLYRHVYSMGNTKDPMEEYILFRGSEPSVEALISKRGLQ